MARGKHHRPLFELLSSSRAPEIIEPPPPPPPPPREAERPRRDPPAPPPAPAFEPRAEHVAVEAPGGYRRVAVPVLTLYAAATFVVVLCVAAFGVGYTLGSGSTVADATGPTEPPYELLDDIVDAGGSGASTDDAAAADASGPKPADAAPRPARADLFGPDGPLSEDPRSGGFNYLQVALLDQTRARDALRALAAGGVRAIAVRAPRSALFRVVAVDVAVSSERYSASRRERSQYEQKVAKVGAAWKKQGGTSDFSSPFWELYQP